MCCSSLRRQAVFSKEAGFQKSILPLKDHIDSLLMKDLYNQRNE